MKISADWLSDYVDLAGVSPAELAERLTVRTAEVEGVETVTRAVDGLVVAEIVTAAAFDAGGRLRYAVTVDVGGGRRFQTVCGAPNVRVGMKSAFAPAGTSLFGGVAVATAELYGQRSEGVLCAPGEIGLGSTKDGLVEVPGSVATGTTLSSLVPATDTIIEIDNKSLTHRPDLWGHYGFAREVAAILGRPLTPWQADNLPDDSRLPPWPVQVDDPIDCPRYSALAFDVTHDPVSPLWMQARLYALGHSPLSALVDVTNYVQFELGQPTHAFDARSLASVRVARSGIARSFTTLDGKAWALLPDDLLIWNGDVPVALAGIMGGLDSRIRPDTRSLVLESATFRASRIRGTSVRLGLRTDSSLRFEKKPPPLYTKLAAGRILRLLREGGLAPTVRSQYTAVGDLHEAPRTITLAPGWLAKRAGADIGDDTAAGILRSIGFGVETSADGGLAVSVPAFRSTTDISIPEDISEEVFRLYGYDNITPKAALGPARPVAANAVTQNQHGIRRLLSHAHRFVEVQTYSWHADDWLETLRYTPARPLLVRNPITPTRRQMRDTILPNLLAAAHQNRNVVETYRFYELGRTFWLDEAGTKHEDDELCAVIVDQSGASPERSLRALQSVIEDAAAAAGIPALRFVPWDGGSARPWLQVGRALSTLRDGKVVGHVGHVPDELAKKLVNGGHVAFAVLPASALSGALFPAARYVTPPQFPGSWQDFTFVWPVSRGYTHLLATLDTFAHPMVEAREFVTVYQPKRSPTANYSFRFLLRAAERTPTQEDLDGFRAAFLGFVGGAGLILG